MQGMLAVLGHEKADLTRFVEVLQREQAALVKGEAEALASFNEQKFSLVESLNAADAERSQLLLKFGLPNDQEGMNRWLESQPQGSPAAKLWENVLTLAREARRLTQLNGQLIAMHLQATSDSLAALNIKARETSVYGPRGLTGSLTGNRIIDSA